MDIRLFDYDLPTGYIAQEPLEKRDQSKLMVLYRETGKVEHKKFYQIKDFFKSGDLLILNNSKVLPVRLYGQKKRTGGKIEVLLVCPLSNEKWKVLLKPGKRVHKGTEIVFSPQLEGEIIDKDEKEGIFLMDMKTSGHFYEILHQIGKMPTPPYIKRKIAKTSLYQTVYASEEGSIAAPTAGFHFTNDLLNGIKEKGVDTIFLTLHIGRGTFEKIRVNQVEEHKMKSELFSISNRDAQAINQAICDNRRIIGVGTSVTRALESSLNQNNKVVGGEYWTDLFIHPGYQFKTIKALITNFHLPRSTPLMLASAFAGKDNLLEAYREAIYQHYRFYSFGDAMLII